MMCRSDSVAAGLVRTTETRFAGFEQILAVQRVGLRG
jgi:hypothetical protein